jgi:hypothetical protein
MTEEGWEIAPGLYELAEKWQTYADVTERACQGLPFRPRCDLEHDAAGRHKAVITRCMACQEEIYPADQIGILRHLFTSHGFRMDGRQFNNRNEELGRV